MPINVPCRYSLTNSSSAKLHTNQILTWLGLFLEDTTNTAPTIWTAYLENYIVTKYIGYGVVPPGSQVCGGVLSGYIPFVFGVPDVNPDA